MTPEKQFFRSAHYRKAWLGAFVAELNFRLKSFYFCPFLGEFRCKKAVFVFHLGYFFSPGQLRFHFGILSLQFCSLRLKLRILLLKGIYRFCLARKGLILFVRRCLIRHNLAACKAKLVAEFGPDWRNCQFENEVVEYLELVKHAHKVMYGPAAQPPPVVGRPRNVNISDRHEPIGR